MKCLNANLVLPDKLVREIQNYAQGTYLYVPVKDGCRKGWGEVSGYRDEIQKRNEEIIEKHKSGSSIEDLSDLFCLSVYAVKRIIYKK